MEKHLRAAELIANLLDNQFELLGRRFGLNGILGLIPWAGDIVVLALSAHLIWIGIKLGLPQLKILHMVWNVAVNFLIGLIPFVGDFADFFHKGNLKNLKILKEHVDRAEKNIIEGKVIA